MIVICGMQSIEKVHNNLNFLKWTMIIEKEDNRQCREEYMMNGQLIQESNGMQDFVDFFMCNINPYFQSNNLSTMICIVKI